MMANTQSKQITVVDPANVIPHSAEVEEGLLGALLIDPRPIYTLMGFMKPDYFFIMRNRWVWEAIVALLEEGTPIDYKTVLTKLTNTLYTDPPNRLLAIGGAARLTYLVNEAADAQAAEAYGRILEAAAIRRNILRFADDVTGLALNTSLSVKQVIEQANATWWESTQQSEPDEYHIRSGLVELHAETEQAMSGEKAITVPTGIATLDEGLGGGFAQKEMIVIAGNTGMGKTQLALSMAYNILVKGGSVAYFWLEQDRAQLARRMVAMDTGIHHQRIRNGKLTQDEWAAFNHAVARMGNWRLYVVDKYRDLNPLQFRIELDRLQHIDNLDLVIIDGLWRMHWHKPMVNRNMEITYISEALSATASKHAIPLLIVHQLSRANLGRRNNTPRLGDLRDSASIEHDASIILALYRPAYFDPYSMEQFTELHFLKYRDQGEGFRTGDRVKLAFDAKRSMYKDWRGALQIR